MTTWSVKPEWKKSIIERNYMTKDGNRLMIETGWRWGEFHIEMPPSAGDTPPVLESGVDLYNCDYEAELIELDDGCWEEHDFDGCDIETTEWLEEFFEESNSWLDLEEHGWSIGRCEMIIDCDMLIEKVEE